MNDKARNLPVSKNGLIKLPAYPFSGREVFHDLRRRLADELGAKTTVRHLSKMLGAPPSTIQYWLEACPHPHVIGLMCLLERLSPSQRQAFVEEHSRPLPTFAHPRIEDNPASRTYLYRLLRKTVGLTLINGGIESSRRFILAAFGHSFPAYDVKRRDAVGLDLHSPNDLVPVESMYYVDGTIGVDRIRASVNQIWPGILTSGGPLVLFNRLWSTLPEFRADIIRLARSRHVVLADEELPGRADLKQIRGEVHLVTISQKTNRFQQFRVSCRRIK